MDERLTGSGMLEPQSVGDYDAGAVGRVTVPWFGRSTTVDALFDRDDVALPPNNLQVRAFCEFMSISSSFFAQLEERILEHFNEARADCNLDDETVETRFPPITEARDLGSLTELTGIVVGYFDGNDWSAYIGLLANCSWEPEHGLGIKVVDGRVSEIGFQDIVT